MAHAITVSVLICLDTLAWGYAIVAWFSAP